MTNSLPSIRNEAVGVRAEVADFLVVGVYANGVLTSPASELDTALGGTLARLIQRGDVSGKQGELVTLLTPAGIAAERVLVVGLGPKEQLNRGVAFRSLAAAAKRLAEKKRARIAYYLHDDWSSAIEEAACIGTLVGCAGQDLYRAEKKLHQPDEVIWAGVHHATMNAARAIGEAMQLTRRLVNEPPSEMYPESFCQVAAATARDFGFTAEIWDQARLVAERCGSLLAVAKGSSRPPRIAILRYAGGKTSDPWLGMVGKGVTFDSGGLSIKPADGMKTMKCDMAGAATVLGALRAIAALNLPVNVMGFCGLVENMLGADAYKVGDVLHARNGRTIEVLNTDAEGRLVLADVLDVALERGAAKLIDLATLTGACVVALGTDVAGAMTNDQVWCDEVLDAARQCGEPLWQLPMFAEYAEDIRSDVADIKNVGNGRWGGAISAAKFLEEFVAGKPWVHLDIAGPAFFDSPKPWSDAGGSGMFVRTLVELARRHAR